MNNREIQNPKYEIRNKSRYTGRSFIFCISYFVFSAASAEAPLRIGVLQRQRSVTLSPGAFRVSDESAGPSHPLSWSGNTAVSADGKGIRLGDRRFGPRIVLEPLDPADPPAVNGRTYRGRLEFLRDDEKTLSVVNSVAVDDYVQGILIHETSPAWPLEALKAQAVISRTYALVNRGRHGSDGFDLCNAVHCQVYGGKLSERDVTNGAVRQTRDQVLTHGGWLISAVFHSCCGGRTEDSHNVWEGSPVPYLKSVRCSWCRKSPRFRWTAEISLEELTRRFAAAGHRIGRVKSLKVLSRSKSGRAYAVRLSGSEGRVDLRANPFRSLADGRSIRSTLWTGISRRGAAWWFTGQGWGHGVGLCQWGAKAMADGGRGYRNILRFYYKGASLEQGAETDALTKK